MDPAVTGAPPGASAGTVWDAAPSAGTCSHCEVRGDEALLGETSTRMTARFCLVAVKFIGRYAPQGMGVSLVSRHTGFP